MRWINLAAVVRLIAVVLSVQFAGIVPALANAVAALNRDSAEHCACCKGRSTTQVSDTQQVTVSAGDADCGDCPPGQPCTDCPAGCASCHSASSARLLLPSAFNIVAFLTESFDGGVVVEQHSPRSPFLSSLERPPKLTAAA